MRRLLLPTLALLAVALHVLLLPAAVARFGVGVAAAALVPLSLVPWAFGARAGGLAALGLAVLYHAAFGLLPEEERVEGQRVVWSGVPFTFVFTLVVAHVREMQRRLEHLNAALARAALTDVLTELPNRRALEADLARAVTERPGAFALALVDVDGLKAVNDTQGHARGDALLRAFAAGFAHAFAPQGRVYRLSGDEFAVLLGRAGDGTPPELRAAVEKAVAAVARGVGTQFPGAGASVGVSPHRPGVGASALLVAADRAMYAHKGRPRPGTGTATIERNGQAESACAVA